MGYASSDEAAGGTWLGIEAVPELETLGADPQFEPQLVQREAFEAKWRQRRGRILDAV